MLFEGGVEGAGEGVEGAGEGVEDAAPMYTPTGAGGPHREEFKQNNSLSQQTGSTQVLEKEKGDFFISFPEETATNFFSTGPVRTVLSGQPGWQEGKAGRREGWRRPRPIFGFQDNPHLIIHTPDSGATRNTPAYDIG